MQDKRRYEFDGIAIDIPIHFDERSKIYIEDYPDFIENPIWTGSGYRVLFSGTDACKYVEKHISDCGSCEYFERAAEHTWFGYCKNEKNKNYIHQPKEEQ